MIRTLLIGACLALFVVAELWRVSHVETATRISLASWALFGLVAVVWARAGGSWVQLLGWLARTAVLAVLSALVLSAYLLHSHLLEAGPHVDAVWTWVGLQWAIALRNPITFIGGTPSYPQSPLMILSHGPAMAVGFERLGPFAMHTSVLLTVAVLLAIMVQALAPAASLWRQGAATALASGCWSTRLLVQGHDAVGYTISGVSLGLAFVAANAVEDGTRRDRLVGGLVALALLHYSFVGITLVLPICAAWLVLRRHPLRATRQFLRANLLLMVVLAMLAITLAIRPDLFFLRMRDVVAGPGKEFQAGLLRKLGHHLPALIPLHMPYWWGHWYAKGGGSWHLVDVPALGGPALPALGIAWLCSWIVGPRGFVRFGVSALAFVVVVTLLAILQHLATDFYDYRDFPALFALSTAGLLFILVAPRLAGTRAGLAWCVALGIAVLNWFDVAGLAGHRHRSHDYGPIAQAVMERLRADTAHAGPNDLGATRLVAVVEPVFPLRAQYEQVLRARGFEIAFEPLDRFCKDREAVLSTLKTRCDAFLLVWMPWACAPSETRGLDPGPVQVDRYESTCVWAPHTPPPTPP